VIGWSAAAISRRSARSTCGCCRGLPPAGGVSAEPLVIGDEITPGSALTPPAGGKPRQQPQVERADRREMAAADHPITIDWESFCDRHGGAEAADRRIAAKPPEQRTVDHQSEQHAAAYVERQPTIGPYNQDDALFRACALIARELDPLRTGATDDQIFQALVQWPTQRVSGSKSGNAWATIGGSQPRFYYDTDAMDKWGCPGVKGATLEGDALVKAVRRLCHIPRPKATKADQQPVRTGGVKS